MPVISHLRPVARFLALGLLLTAAAWAQRYSFRTYGEAEGLTDLNANFILQDHDGFIWVATTSGVFRFDGHRFRRYGIAEGLPSSLALSMAEDANGDLLVTTPTGVARRQGDRFVVMDTGGHLPTRCPHGIALDNDTVYVATTTGLYWRSAGGASGVAPGTEGKAAFSVTTGPDTAARNKVSASGDIWYAVENSVCRWHPKGNTQKCYDAESGLPAERWGGIVTDVDGTVWVRNAKHLLALPRGASRFESRDSGLSVATRLGAISLDSAGRLMLGTEAGLARWPTEKASGEAWSMAGVANGLTVPSVTWAMEDREGSIWVGMLGGGVARWLGAREWESWTSQQGLSDDTISAIARDREGRFLVGTAFGVNILEGEHVGTLKIGSLAASGNRIRSIAGDGDHSIWLATSPGGIGVIDTRSGALRRFDASSGLDPATIFTLAVDRSGAVWVGGSGIYRGVKRQSGGAESWEWKRIPIPPAAGSGNTGASEDFFAIVEDRAGRVWFGGSNGVAYWDGSRAVRLGVSEGMPAGTAAAMTIAPDGSVLVGMNDLPDLYRIVARSDKGNQTHFSAEPFRGPPSASGGGPIYVLGFDKAGNLWRGGTAGLDACIQNRWVHYGRADGLVWNTISRNAFVADPDGSVWIGTTRGLSHHFQAAVSSGAQAAIPRAEIVGLSVGGREVTMAGTPRIGHQSGNIVIGFASPVFVHEKDVRFRYRLSGLETAWTETTEWAARYSGMKPGNYVFEVQSGDWNGRWTTESARLSFEVTGPFWTSTWFTTAWTGSLAMLALVGWRVRDRAHVRREGELGEAVRRRTAELEQGRQRDKSRNEILQNLVSNQPRGMVLRGIAELLNDQIAGGSTVILLRNADGWYAEVAPGCRAEWVAALEVSDAVPIEICRGAWLCEDPAREPAWRKFVSHAGDFLPCAIGSVAIDGPDGAAGAILFLYATPPGAEPWMDILSTTSRMAQVVIEHHRFYDDLQFQAHHDGLTGLPNRAWFGEKLSRTVASARDLGKKIAVLFIDIDHFKDINDRLSHRAGDIVLSTLAKRMKGALRSGDTVARIGGDEFNILLEDVTGTDAVSDIASTVLTAIREPVMIDGVQLDVSASIGIAVFPDDAAGPEELQREADAAMYCAKNLGRNRMQAFGARERALDGEHIDQALRQALQDRLFSVHYQPKVDADGRFVGFEALLRMNHPKLGNVPPAVFIPIAEAKGLIVPIGAWVLDEVCRQIASWRERGFGEIPVAINVSPLQIARPDFSELVRECLGRRNIPPYCVELELTESQALSGADEAREQMIALREMGIRFSIDDFGTGYSSLSYLYRLHVDAIKLDRSFVQAIDSDEGARRVVQAMIGVAEALGLNVIAEGVETAEQRDALIAAGCAFMQGYYFSRPQPAACFDGMLSTHLRPGTDLRRLYSALGTEPAIVSV